MGIGATRTFPENRARKACRRADILSQSAFASFNSASKRASLFLSRRRAFLRSICVTRSSAARSPRIYVSQRGDMNAVRGIDSSRVLADSAAALPPAGWAVGWALDSLEDIVARRE